MLGHKKTVSQTQADLDAAEKAVVTATGKAEAATRAYIAANSATQSAKSALDQANARPKQGQCYTVAIQPTCGGIGRPMCHTQTNRFWNSPAINLPAQGLQCPTTLSKQNWLTRDTYPDVFNIGVVSPTQVIASRTDAGGPWGMTAQMSCCDMSGQKAQDAAQANYNVAQSAASAASSQMARSNNDLAAARSERDKAKAANDAAKAAQANQKY